MKIQCDACNKQHASLFCTADEAALCEGCDHRVHHANKLASKHQRFSLHHPSSNQYPICDVCKERRAFVFCQQDRAILCKECDYPIHSANDHTKNHNRFLLTGTKLSATSTPYSSISSTSGSKNNCSVVDSCDVPLMTRNCSSTASTNNLTNEEGAGFTSSISDYLIKNIPGWQVEDFLDSPSPVTFGFSKSGDDMLALFDADLEGKLGSSFSNKSMGGIRVPQAPYSVQMDHHQIGYVKEPTNVGSRRLEEDNFIVPQMSTANISSKRPRLQRH